MSFWKQAFTRFAVRAVSRGTFTLPPIKAECMYEPEVYSVTADGVMVVEE